MTDPSVRSNMLMTEPPGGRLVNGVQLPFLPCAYAMELIAASAQTKTRHMVKELIVL
jgi:hypothetical protein